MNNQMLIESSPKTMKIGAKEVRPMPMFANAAKYYAFHNWPKRLNTLAHMCVCVCVFAYINTMHFHWDGATTKQRHNWLNQNDLSITFDWAFKYQGDLLKMGIKLKITVQQSIATARMRGKTRRRARGKSYSHSSTHNVIPYCRYTLDVCKQTLLPPATPHI